MGIEPTRENESRHPKMNPDTQNESRHPENKMNPDTQKMNPDTQKGTGNGDGDSFHTEYREQSEGTLGVTSYGQLGVTSKMSLLRKSCDFLGKLCTDVERARRGQVSLAIHCDSESAPLTQAASLFPAISG
jgi:hypothetical protein